MGQNRLLGFTPPVFATVHSLAGRSCRSAVERCLRSASCALRGVFPAILIFLDLSRSFHIAEVLSPIVHREARGAACLLFSCLAARGTSLPGTVPVKRRAGRTCLRAASSVSHSPSVSLIKQVSKITAQV